ncbi:MAG: ankyrin repeat domain-containing protein, partial [Desulfobacterales bacterium]
FLLSQNAEVNLQDRLGRSALLLAASEGHAAIVEQLLAKGAKASLTNKSGRTALDVAAAEGHEQVVRILEGN